MNASILLLLFGVVLLVVALLRWNAARHEDINRAIEQYSGYSPSSDLTAMQLARQTARRFSGLGKLEWNLRWAQRNGEYKGQELVSAVILKVALYGLVGLALPLLHPAPVSWFAPLILGALPLTTLQRKGEDARKRALRGVPEAATLVAAELAANVAPEQAIERAAVLPGPLSVLISDTLETSRQEGRPLFSHGETPGVLRRVFNEAGVPALSAFAAQLDIVAEKGVEGAFLMSEIARSLAREHREMVLNDTEKLDGRLTVAVAMFYFIPMFVLIVGSFFAAVLTSMAGG